MSKMCSYNSSKLRFNCTPRIFKDRKTGATYLRKKYFLGEGSFAKCYSALNLNDGRMYVAKILKQDMGRSARRDFLQEAKLLVELQHPNVLKLFGVCNNRGYLAIITELCDGGCIYDMIRNRRNLTVFETRYFMRQILQGLSHIHANLVIHRDIKADNIFLTERLQIKIADFGVSQRLSRADELTYSECSAKAYRAPEIDTGAGYSFQIDVWAAGCLMYEMLAGEVLFLAADGAKIISDKFAQFLQIQKKLKKLDPLTAQVLWSMLKLNPAKRLSAKDVLKHKFFKVASPDSLPLWCLKQKPVWKILENVEDEQLQALRELVEGSSMQVYDQRPLEDVTFSDEQKTLQHATKQIGGRKRLQDANMQITGRKLLEGASQRIGDQLPSKLVSKQIDDRPVKGAFQRVDDQQTSNDASKRVVSQRLLKSDSKKIHHQLPVNLALKRICHKYPHIDCPVQIGDYKYLKESCMEDDRQLCKGAFKQKINEKALKNTSKKVIGGHSLNATSLQVGKLHTLKDDSKRINGQQTFKSASKQFVNQKPLDGYCIKVGNQRFGGLQHLKNASKQDDDKRPLKALPVQFGSQEPLMNASKQPLKHLNDQQTLKDTSKMHVGDQQPLDSPKLESDNQQIHENASVHFDDQQPLRSAQSQCNEFNPRSTQHNVHQFVSCSAKQIEEHNFVALEPAKPVNQTFSISSSNLHMALAALIWLNAFLIFYISKSR